jgi:hypothetical protein
MVTMLDFIDGEEASGASRDIWSVGRVFWSVHDGRLEEQ